MKNFASPVIAITLLFVFACSGGDHANDPLPQQQALEQLTGTWKISSVIQDRDRTADFQSPDLTLTLSGDFDANAPEGPYSYTLEGNAPAPSPWPYKSGVWLLDTDPEPTIVRDDGVRMAFTLMEKNLTLTFSCITCNTDGGRLNSAEGNWVFHFSKQ